jgi:hypothetical protein
MKTTTTNHERNPEPSTAGPHANPTRISAASGTVDAPPAPYWQKKQTQQQKLDHQQRRKCQGCYLELTRETENSGFVPRGLPLITVIYDLRFVRWKQ